MKTDKETDITLQHKIGNTLTTELMVPAARKEITLADTIITNNREVITAEEKSIWKNLWSLRLFCLGANNILVCIFSL